MDALVSSIICELTTVQQEFRLVGGVEEEIEKLKRNFITIQSLVEDAERRRSIKETGVKQWLDRLNRVCYDMEDVLVDWKAQEVDLREWDIKVAEAKATYPAATHNKSKSKSKLTQCFLPSFCFPSNPPIKQVKPPPSDRIPHRIKSASEILDQINSDKSIYKFAEASYVDDALKMKCRRDDEKRNLINKLLCPIDEEHIPPLVAIVGRGGIGKTALARLVYNDEDVELHFHERIWICVSGPLCQVKIAREIIRALDSSNPAVDSCQLDYPMRVISQLVSGKRILLVLDDVRSDVYGGWEKFQACLARWVDPQSRILVTTRKHGVARVMDKTYNKLHMF